MAFISMSRFEFARALQAELSDLLGTFPNGNLAIWEDAGDVPSGVKGLLCLIERSPSGSTQTGILNDQATVEFDWVCRLIQNDRSQSGLAMLDQACQRIRELFPNQREREVPYADGDPVQVLFLCRFYVLRNTFVSQ